MRVILSFLFIIICLTAHAQKDLFPTNFHVVEGGVLYRSGQPTKKEMRFLEEQGIVTLLNLRYRVSDRRELKGTSMKEYRLKMKAQSVDEEDMLNGLRAIMSSDKAVLVHCLHGSDRTGALVACYRMVVQDWPKEDAIDEFLQEQYGYNKAWFPNLETFLRTYDVQKAKSLLFSKSN